MACDSDVTTQGMWTLFYRPRYEWQTAILRKCAGYYLIARSAVEYAANCYEVCPHC